MSRRDAERESSDGPSTGQQQACRHLWQCREAEALVPESRPAMRRLLDDGAARSGRSTPASAAKLRPVAKAKEPKGQNTDGMNGGNQFSIVAVDASFRLRVTRDTRARPARSPSLSTTRFRPTPRRIRIPFATRPTARRGAVELLVQDNGTGMDPFTLRTALRFGGTTRFNDRTGLGRYGMGLPNSSLSPGTPGHRLHVANAG